VFLVDTIGFVMDLDPRLIESFSLTLDDIRFSDLILLTVDASDSIELMFLKVKTCLDCLNTLGVKRDRVIVVLNKCDLIRNMSNMELKIGRLQPLIRDLDYCMVSAKNKTGFKNLFTMIAHRLSQLQRSVEKSSVSKDLTPKELFQS
jgi:GTP-binding protein HflX